MSTCPSRETESTSRGHGAGAPALVPTGGHGAEGDTHRKRMILSRPEDHEYLTDLLCLVRKQVEVFVAPPRDDGFDESNDYFGQSSGGENSELYVRGKVGIRCVHCAPLHEERERGDEEERVGRQGGQSTSRSRRRGGKNRPRKIRGAAAYPNCLRLVYHTVRNWQRNHMLTCPSLPPELRDEIVAMTDFTMQRRSGNDSVTYWERSCIRLGLEDDDRKGLRLFKAAWDGTWTDTMATEAARKFDEERERAKLERRQAKDSPPPATAPDDRADAPTAVRTLKSDMVLPGANSAASAQKRIVHPVNSATTSCAAPIELPTNSCLVSSNKALEKVIQDLAELPKAAALAPLSLPDPAVAPVKMGLAPNRTSPWTNRAGGPATALQEPGPQIVNASGSMLGSSNSNRVGAEDESASSALILQTLSPQHVPVHNLSGSGGSNSGVVIATAPSESLGRQGIPLPAAFPSALQQQTPRPVLPAGASPQTAGRFQKTPSLLLTGASHQTAPLLERVRLARDMVRAAGMIRPLSPEEEDFGVGAGGRPGSASFSEELRDLGAELYELFSGRRPLLDNSGDGENAVDDLSWKASKNGNVDLGSMGQQQKRGKHPESRKGRTFVSLSELGVPSALCGLVSGLLEATNSDSEAQDINVSIKEVEADLDHMISYPDKFLFDPVTAMPGSVLPQLDISQDVLYGREKEFSALIDAYETMSNPTEVEKNNNMVLISGYSGTGKSSIVGKAKSEFVQRGARFVSGTYDSMQQMQPLSGIVCALNEYCDALAQDVGQIDQVRAAISSVLGSEGRVLADLVPNLRKVLPNVTDGSRSPTTQVWGREAQYRLVFLVRMLFRATCGGQHRPVVLFLDNLHWADEASLELMSALVTDSQLKAFLFVGCYRDIEAGPGHPLMNSLDGIRRAGGATITPMHISNLGKESVNSLVSEALHMLPRTTRPLADSVWHKTGGNALFVVQLLRSLCDEGLLRYSLSTRRWAWDISNIQARDIANNVVELMTAKLQKMAPEVLEALRVAAALGAECEEDLLSILDRTAERITSTAFSLNGAVAEALMSKDGSSYRWCHDQIQLAAYQLIPETDRPLFHLTIGRMLWKFASAEEIETHIFVLVYQLHRGSSLITDRDEKIALAELSLVAGQKAATMSAFLPASAYFNAGVGLLVDDDWQRHRELCFDLHNLASETEYILGRFNSMQKHLDMTLSKGETLKTKLRAYHTLILSLGAQGRTADAINLGIEVLGHLGETLPEDSSTVGGEVEMTQQILSLWDYDTLLGLKRMESAEKRDVMRFLHCLILYAFTDKKSWFPVPVCRLVRLSLSHGVCKESAFAFASYGIVMCSVGNYSEGYQYGKLAISIIERFNANEHCAKVAASHYAVIAHWTEPIQSVLPPLKRAIEVGLATGDTEFAMMTAHAYVAISFGSGASLGPLAEEMDMYSKQAMQYNQNRICLLSKPCHQMVLNLLGRSTDPTEISLLTSVKDSDRINFLSLLFRMLLEYMFGEYEKCVETWIVIKDQTGSFQALIPSWCYSAFFSCLAALALARSEGRTEYIETIDKSMALMKTWARATPWNCQNKLALMKAEYAYLSGDLVMATKCYQDAIDLAVEHRFIHEQALALERYGIFHMETGDHTTASGLFARARDCYSLWGAVTKVAHINERYL